MKHCNNPQCKIQWIDDSGKETPDSNPAVGMAVCVDAGKVIGAFPICAEHAKQAIPYSNWKVIPFETFNQSCK